MSMVMYLRRASEADIAKIGEDADVAEHFVFAEGDGDRDLVDFDVAWGVVHFMLCGEVYDTTHPLGIVARQLPERGLDANGFGGFSVITPETMAQFSKALAVLDDDALARCYDPAAWEANAIYPGDMFVEYDTENSEETRAYVMQGIPALRRLAAGCAARGDGAIRMLR